MQRHILIGIFLVIFFGCSLCMAQEVRLSEGFVWSQQSNAITKSKDETVTRLNRGTLQIKHVGNQDWSYGVGKQTGLKAGAIIEVSVWIKHEADNNVTLSVVPRTAEGKTISWTYGAIVAGRPTSDAELKWQSK